VALQAKQNLPMPLEMEGEINPSAFSEGLVYVNCSDCTDVSPGGILTVSSKHQESANREGRS
jgi:hypothetical protein